MCRKVIVFGVITLSLLFCISHVNADTFEHRNNYGGWPNCVTSSGQYAFINGGASIAVLDMALEKPMQVSSVALLAEPNHMVRVDNLIYCTGGMPALQIVDITNPLKPVLLGSADIEDSWARFIAVANGRAYIACPNKGLVYFDVSDPTSPTYIGIIEKNIHNVTVQGNYAYILEYGGIDDYLHVVELAPAETPIIVGSVIVGGTSQVAVLGDYAYVANGWNSGMQIVDISTPATPQVVGTYGDGNKNAMEIAVFEGSTIACIGDRSEGLTFVDVSDPVNPAEISTLPDVGAEMLYLDYPDLYVVYGGDEALKVVDLTDSANPTVKSQYNSPAAMSHQHIENLEFYIGTMEGLFAYDLTDSGPPRQLAYYSDYPAGIVFALGNHLYIISEKNLIILDASDPAAMTELGRHPIDNVVALAVLDDIAYALTANSLILVDVTDPQNIHRRVEMNDVGGNDIFVRGGSATAFVTNDSGLLIVNADDPDNPVLENTMGTFGQATCVWVDGDSAYVGSNAEAISGKQFVIESFNVSDRANPQKIAETLPEDGEITDIENMHGYNYAAILEGGVYIYHTSQLIPDLRWQGAARILSMYNMEGLKKAATNEHVHGCNCAVCSPENNNIVHTTTGTPVDDDIRITAPTRFRLDQNTPNPFNPMTSIQYHVEKTSFVILKVYDVKGREVQTLVHRDQGPGTYDAIFDASGLPSGIYFYRIQMRGFTDVKKMILME